MRHDARERARWKARLSGSVDELGERVSRPQQSELNRAQPSDQVIAVSVGLVRQGRRDSESSGIGGAHRPRPAHPAGNGGAERSPPALGLLLLTSPSHPGRRSHKASQSSMYAIARSTVMGEANTCGFVHKRINARITTQGNPTGSVPEKAFSSQDLAAPCCGRSRFTA
jgi:hypothetical protein